MAISEHLLPISALQHLLFCERQCALIHVERLWVENRLTIEGQHLHQRAHEGTDEYRKDVIIARALPLRSDALGLVGVADVVELYPQVAGHPSQKKFNRIVPVEYKHRWN